MRSWEATANREATAKEPCSRQRSTFLTCTLIYRVRNTFERISDERPSARCKSLYYCRAYTAWEVLFVRPGLRRVIAPTSTRDSCSPMQAEPHPRALSSYTCRAAIGLASPDHSSTFAGRKDDPVKERCWRAILTHGSLGLNSQSAFARFCGARVWRLQERAEAESASAYWSQEDCTLACITANFMSAATA